MTAAAGRTETAPGRCARPLRRSPAPLPHQDALGASQGAERAGSLAQRLSSRPAGPVGAIVSGVGEHRSCETCADDPASGHGCVLCVRRAGGQTEPARKTRGGRRDRPARCGLHGLVRGPGLRGALRHAHRAGPPPLSERGVPDSALHPVPPGQRRGDGAAARAVAAGGAAQPGRGVRRPGGGRCRGGHRGGAGGGGAAAAGHPAPDGADRIGGAGRRQDAGQDRLGAGQAGRPRGHRARHGARAARPDDGADAARRRTGHGGDAAARGHPHGRRDGGGGRGGARTAARQGARRRAVRDGAGPRRPARGGRAGREVDIGRGHLRRGPDGPDAGAGRGDAAGGPVRAAAAGGRTVRPDRRDQGAQLRLLHADQVGDAARAHGRPGRGAGGRGPAAGPGGHDGRRALAGRGGDRPRGFHAGGPVRPGGDGEGGRGGGRAGAPGGRRGRAAGRRRARAAPALAPGARRDP